MNKTKPESTYQQTALKNPNQSQNSLKFKDNRPRSSISNKANQRVWSSNIYVYGFKISGLIWHNITYNKLQY